MRHIRCGDDGLEALTAAGVSDPCLGWLDPLCEGPTPAGLEPAIFRSRRAEWAARRYGLNHDTVLARLTAQDCALDQAIAVGDEVVLWCDHTLFDQIILIYWLDRLWPHTAGRLSLISLHRHAAVRRFLGFGQLTSEQLAALIPGRRRVSGVQAALAGQAWRAFTAASPEPLEGLMRDGDFTPLPYLRGALDRHRRQYPWCRHGLAATEALILQALVAGAHTPEAVYAFVQAREPIPWQAPAMITAWLDDLSHNLEPLAQGNRAALSALLAGEWRAAMRERWLGGVHLSPDGPDWRWNDAEGRLVDWQQPKSAPKGQGR